MRSCKVRDMCLFLFLLRSTDSLTVDVLGASMHRIAELDSFCIKLHQSLYRGIGVGGVSWASLSRTAGRSRPGAAPTTGSTTGGACSPGQTPAAPFQTSGTFTIRSRPWKVDLDHANSFVAKLNSWQPPGPTSTCVIKTHNPNRLPPSSRRPPAGGPTPSTHARTATPATSAGNGATTVTPLRPPRPGWPMPALRRTRRDQRHY